jgi:hypothetical protein
MKHIHDDHDNFLRRSSIRGNDEGMVDRMGHELDSLGFGESRERWIEWVACLENQGRGGENGSRVWMVDIWWRGGESEERRSCMELIVESMAKWWI